MAIACAGSPGLNFRASARARQSSSFFGKVPPDFSA
jgi:hypothetical protein